MQLHKPLVVALVIVGFALRLAFAFGYWVDKPLTLDEQEYLLLANRLAAGEGLTYPARSASTPPMRHFERPPAFPVFLAVVLKATRGRLITESTDADIMDGRFPQSSSEVPPSIKVAQALVGAVGVLLIAVLARRVAGPSAGVIAAAMAAVYPPLVWMCGYVISEPLYSTLVLGAAWLLQVAGDSYVKPFKAGAGAGLLVGVAMLAREAAVIFVPLAAVWLIARRRPALALVFVAGAALVTLPWAARNASEDGIVFGAAHGGVNFWIGNNALARGEGDLAANPQMGSARKALEDQYAGGTAGELDAAYYRAARTYIMNDPIGWTALLAKKLFYTFVPIGPSYRLHSTRYFAASIVSYTLLFPVAFAGLWQLVRHGAHSRIATLLLLAASAVAANLLFFPQERYRIPVLDPTAVVCAAALCRDRSTPVAATETDARAS